MNLQEKTEAVDSLRDRFTRASVTLLTEPRGMTVAEVTELRNNLLLALLLLKLLVMLMRHYRAPLGYYLVQVPSQP